MSGTSTAPISMVARARARLGLDELSGAGSLWPLFVLFGLNAVDELDQVAFNILSPNIRDHFGLDNLGITSLRAALIPVVIGLGLPIAYWADRRRRTRIAAAGAAAWGGFSILTGFAPNLVVLYLARVGSGLGSAVNAPTHDSLLADYYPPDARAGAYGVHRLANSVGQFAGPLAAGGIAYLFGWRVPFLVLAIPTFVFVALAVRLREPVRGGFERRAQGADAATADIEEEPPSWEESWRSVMGVATMRRVYRAAPFLIGGVFAIGTLRNLYYDEVFGLNEFQRGVLEAVNEPFQIFGLLLGIPVATRLIRTDPSRVFRFFALSATVSAVGFVGFALAPNVVIAAVSSCAIAFAAAVLVPGLSAISSLILPPRARSFGFSLFRLYALPGLVIALPIGGGLGDAFGMRVGILVMTPIFLLGAYLLASAGAHVAADVRTTQLASVAAAEFRSARESGQAKLLVCRGVDVRYDQVQVLFGIDFDVADGEIVALLGTNGAGKSTLLKAVCGLVDPSGGAVIFDGTDVTYASAQQTLRRGVVYMPGGKAVFPTLSVAENLRAASWTLHGRGGASGAGDSVEDVLERFPRLRERFHQPAGNLSGGEQQMLGLGMAFLARPRLLLIDELSLGLAPTVIADLLVTVREIHDRGTTIVLVEQSVNLALTIAERAVFLEKGEVRFEGRTADLLGREDVMRSVFLEGASKSLGGNGRGPAAPRRARPGGTSPVPTADTDDTVTATSDDVVLRVEGVCKAFGGINAVEDVTLEVRRGEVVGLIGPNGAGKTTLFDVVSGYLPADHGRVLFLGDDVTSIPAHGRARRGLGRSFQDARLFPSMTVREAIALSHDRHLALRDPVSALLALPDQRIEETLVRRRVDDLIEVVGLGAFADKFVAELSTGSRRIVDLACALAHDPTVLLLDEPSSGIAQRETEALGPLLRTIQSWTGTSLLIIEHDMPLITETSDRLVALDLGRVIAEGAPAEVVAAPAVVASYLGDDRSVLSRSGAVGPGPTRRKKS